MKKFLLISSLSFFIFVLTMFYAKAQIFSGGGNGTVNQPYVIRNKMDMDTLAFYCNTGTNWSAGKHFLLQQNLVGVNQIIGSSTYPSDSIKWFQGYFHGNNKTITLNVNSTNLNNVALFGGFKAGSIDSLTIIGSITGGYNVAGLVGRIGSGAYIRNCINRATINANGAVAGGIVGNSDVGTIANILNCRNYGNITSNGDNAGGIAGIFYGTIEGCFNYGKVSADNIVGGIISQNVGEIKLCGNSGKISGTSKVGGISGENNATVNNCINLGLIEGSTLIGGISGLIQGMNSSTNAIIITCHNSGIIASDNDEKSGGIAGECTVSLDYGPQSTPYDPPIALGTANITYCLNTGSVLAGSGIVGKLDGFNYSVITSNYYDKQMSHYSGGIDGADVAGKAEGLLTKNMIYGNLNIGTGWTSRNTLDGYPYITEYMNINYAQAAAFSIVASAAMCIDDNNVTDSITNHFKVSRKSEEVWTTKNNKVTILDTTVTLISLWNDSMICTLDSARKSIPIMIVDIPADNVFNIVVYASPVEGGTVSGTGTYKENDTCVIEAHPNEHYTFGDWEEEPSGNHFAAGDTIVKVPVTRNQRFRANFIIDTTTLSLLMEPNYMGNVFGSGKYGWNSKVEFFASPFYGYHFVKWTDEEGELYSDLINDTITLDTNRTLTAHFDKDTFEVKVSVEPDILGTAAGAGRYPYLDTAKITTEGADSCYKFNGWYEGDSLVSNEPNFDLIVKKDYDIVAYYTAVERIVTLKVNPPEAGTVEGDGSYDCKPTEIEVKVIANPEYRFVNWTDNATGEQISTKEVFNYTVTKNIDWTANFIPDTEKRYILTLSAYPEDGGTVTGAGLYDSGQMVYITAVANEDNGYEFTTWSKIDASGNAVSISTAPNYSFDIEEDTELIAFFSNSRNVIVGINPAYMGKIEGNAAGFYPYNSDLSFKAIPIDATLYKFTYWSNIANDTISKDSILQLKLISDTNVIANFDFIDKITETEYWNNFKISPNPTNDVLNIEFKALQAMNIDISLSDLSGKNIVSLYSGIAEENFRKQFNVSNLHSGMYYVIVTVNRKRFMENVIINK